MKITLKLFASLGAYLPPGAIKNAVEIEAMSGITPAGVIERFKVPLELAHLVLIDGVYVAPEERNRRNLRDNEVLAIFPPVAGG